MTVDCRPSRHRAEPEPESTARLELIATSYRGTLMRYLLGLASGDWHLAEDMLQETLLRTWRNIDSVPVDQAQRSWLFTVARRVAIDRSRRRKARPCEVAFTGAAETAATDDPCATIVAAESAVQAVRALKPAQRQLLAELYLNGRTIAETARLLGIPEGTVRSRAHYAVRSIRSALEDTADRPAAHKKSPFRSLVRPAAR